MQVPNQYPLVALAALSMSWQAWGFGLSLGRFRRETFNVDFMRKQFGTIHQKQLGEDIELGGYPDAGSGLYSQRLSYRDWYRFNVLQRIHLNYVEGMSLAQTSLLSAGLFRPREAALVGLFYILGRFLYAKGYKGKRGAHSKLRIFGVGLSTLAVVVNTGIFLYHLAKHLKA